MVRMGGVLGVDMTPLGGAGWRWVALGGAGRRWVGGRRSGGRAGVTCHRTWLPFKMDAAPHLFPN